MKFVVKEASKISPPMGTYPHVTLGRVEWDDYGYKTSFYATIHLSDNQRVELGTVRILQVDQTSGRTLMPASPFEMLGPNYCSLGRDLDYYEKLFKLPSQYMDEFCKALGDVAYSDERRAVFEDFEGFKVSLLRSPGAARTLENASKLLLGNRDQALADGSEGYTTSFKTKVAASANPVTIKLDFARAENLPHRINVVVGYNGTGKTRLLANLAVAASGYGYNNKAEFVREEAGRFIGTSPFKKVIVVSYSAFDTFPIPTKAENEDARSGADNGRYLYCGLREPVEVSGNNGLENSDRLKTSAELDEEFSKAVSKARKPDRSGLLTNALRPLFREPSFQQVELTPLLADADAEDLRFMFKELSSGHKFALKVIVELAAYMNKTEPTLILIDEPETHLHPPLLAALLKSVRSCLSEFNGYAVIVTHSPVVLQEVPSRFVHKLKRSGPTSSIAPAAIETFAENIGIITQEVFDLDDSSTDWHDTLLTIAKGKTLEELDVLFGKNLGFTARSYVISALMTDQS